MLPKRGMDTRELFAKRTKDFKEVGEQTTQIHKRLKLSYAAEQRIDPSDVDEAIKQYYPIIVERCDLMDDVMELV